jgi:Ribonuclease G/E
MSARRFFLDESVGETRGVVTLDDRPERLIIRRHDEDVALSLGAQFAARVASLEPALATAFLDLGEGREAILPFKPDAKPVRGAMLAIEIRAEARQGKLAIARVTGEGEGAPRLLNAAPDVRTQLEAFARGQPIESGHIARQVADEAETDALEVLHSLPGGGVLAVEPTRALTAIDIDLGERKGQDAKRVTKQANHSALKEAARLLRLKGLGGIVVIDLVGRGHDGNALLTTARMAFGPDNPGVSIGPVGRFGTMELSLPRRGRPLADILCRVDGALSDRTLAQRALRRLETEGAAQPGSRLTLACASEIAGAARPLLNLLAARLGARFEVAARDGWARERFEVFSA